MAYGTNNIGIYFSDTELTSSGQVLPYTPQIQKYSNPVLSDTLEWMEIKGILMGSGVEKYMIIGNFFTDLETDTIGNDLSGYNGAYYFIDDVSVIPVDSIPGGMPAFAGNDTTIMYGDTLFIGQEIYGLNCNWYDANNNQIATNISGIDVSPDSTTYYVVEQNLCSNITYDTIWVTVDTSNMGVENINQKATFTVFPNPGNDQFSISTSLPAIDLNVIITSLSGQIVYSMNLHAKNGVYTFEPELSRGVYFITITDASSRQSEVKRLVIQ